MKHVRQSAAAQKIGAIVILKNGKYVATIQTLTGGSVQVDAWTNSGIIHQRKAGGYGYDRFTAALRGATIDGVRMYDHCVQSEETLAYLAQYNSAIGEDAKRAIYDRARAAGIEFANYSEKGYLNAYYVGGIDRLRSMGYDLIYAI